MKNSEIKVSVVIPVYNVEKYLEECLESLVNQTLKEIEIICVDDGSTDNSLKILDHYAKIDDRVKILKQKNQYAGVARNNGLKAAKGEYVIFLDSDDFFDKTLLKKAYSKGINTDADVVLFGGCCYNMATNSYIERKDYLHVDYIPKKETFSREDVPEKIFSVSTLSPWTKMFKRSFVINEGMSFSPLANSNDLYFVMCGMAFAKKIAYVNETLVYYRIGQESNLQSKKSKYPLCFLDAYEALYDTLVERGIFDEVKKSYITALVSSCVYNLDTAKPSKDSTIIETQALIMERITGKLAKKINILEFPDNFYGDKFRISKLRGYEYALKWNKKVSKPKGGKPSVVIDSRTSKEPKVSVLIPVYNTELYLKQCVDSITGQTLKDIEIICIDDGSKDDSLEILKAYAKNDSRFCVCTQENAGLAATRNRAVSFARGKYVYCMDSDDILAEDALRVLYEKAEKQNLDILYFDGDCFSDAEECSDLVESNNKRYSRQKSYDDVYSGKDLMMYMRKKGEYQVSACLQIFKRQFFINNSLWFEEGILHEDELFTYKSMLSAKYVSHINMKLFHRRYRLDSIMTSNVSFGNVYGYFKCYLEMSRFAEKLSLEPDCEDTALEILGSRLLSARDRYQQLTEAERWTYLGLSPYEQTKFKLYVIPAVNTVKQVNNERAKQLEKELNFIKNSHSFKLGFALVYPFSRIKSLFIK